MAPLTNGPRCFLPFFRLQGSVVAKEWLKPPSPPTTKD